MSRARLQVCADDFGQSPAIDRAILGLAERGRIGALSCLTQPARWREAARALQGLSARCGLHFNLTDGEPVSAELRRAWPVLPALPRLIALAHLRRLPLDAIAREWDAQWGRFVQATGREPDHVDGHQHVHHLPGVRAIVLAAAARAGCAVRNTGHVAGPGFALKRMLIEASGGRALQRTLRARGLAHNAVLVGCYDFARADYRGLVRGWLDACRDGGGLLFCHPGDAAAADDPIGSARVREAAYLGSDAFADDLAAAGLTVESGRSSVG